MTEILYGRNPVYESLRAGRREPFQLTLAEGVRETDVIADIVRLAGERNLPVERASRNDLDRQTDGGNHQGVLLRAGPYPYCALEEILAQATGRDDPPFLLLLDLLQDVQNIGSLMRTADAVGVHGVVIQDRRSPDVTPAVVRASSGAAEHLRVARVTNLVRAMETLKEAGVWLAGLALHPDASRYDEADLTGALGLVVGSEGKGLRRLVRETCDFLVHLPMGGQVDSLNAAIAGSVALYAAWQARGFGGE